MNTPPPYDGPTPPPALAIHAHLDTPHLDIDLDLTPGTVLAVVGPNGAGKTSLLRLTTGQLRPHHGTVALHGRPVSGPHHHVPVHHRGVALLAQRPLLFDHLTVLDNVAFSLRARGIPRSHAHQQARHHLELVGCSDLATRRTWQISGGQAQRVALARALAGDPALLLLDEPMAALDVTVATTTRALLRDLLAPPERTAILVTHDVIDVLALADMIALVDEGRIVESGPVAAVLRCPRAPFLAELTGVNLLEGQAIGGDVIDVAGVALTGIPSSGTSTGASLGASAGVSVPSVALRVGRSALATFPPGAVGVHLADPGGSPRNHLPAVVVAVEPRGPVVRVVTSLHGTANLSVSADITAVAAVELDIRPGTAVQLVVKATQVTLYER
ncbi:Molybdenum import ATP-binding protein ModC [Austwickia sp. TVS 96-490-7B]|uniref:sulfate/molybdate ABC transporter ATP-binding protein n=1 Tax=Austwickia sp. TVS 96-490-7B TaxID=2830843 RepID=UPI001C564BA0|nr:ATP-binding cassette domain-containing protein [Austwickia sp. TVS 96-490-7B]MBW3086675.1 Molybdenum import ATP-binding protein ModC [Austwickia sp. TVS 96-490-7B]